MKMKKKLFWLVFVIGFVLSACSDGDVAIGNDNSRQETALEHAEKHADPKYVCPMHSQIVRDNPGKCPICGMNLVKKEAEQESSSGEKKILYWVAPMDPAYRREGPGKSPMGMDLVPVYDEGGGTSVKISPAVENNMGVRTAVVVRDKFWRKINTVGYVDFDERKISHIHVRSHGWIEKMVVDSEGERVVKGQLLFEFFSPELVNAQDDYLQAILNGGQFLKTASHDRLLALGISRQQIRQITKTRKSEQFIRVYAPQDGIISKLAAREGMYITPSKEVMSLADLSSIWILAEVFESQSSWVKEKQPADVRLSYLPGREWEGTVEYIYPSLNEQTRTLKVRLVFPNPDEVLKPNMFANVSIYGGPKNDVLIIPSEALIRTGGDARVILAEGKGRFKPRKVVVGIESGDFIEIQQGLMEGDRVVTSGQFLIDSEASLKASLQRMQSPSTEKTNASSKMESDQDDTKAASATGEMDHSQHTSMEKKIEGKGVIREIMASEGRVKISHEPIPELNWPDMTMFFQLLPAVKLDNFKPEDKVEFELQQADDGYVIKAMRKLEK